MKISLWKQFSSNHSSNFTIIGEFDTRDVAERAVEAITLVLEQIRAWNSTQEGEDFWFRGVDLFSDPPSPPEIEIAQRYKIDWKHPIDWYGSYQIDIVLDRLVRITPTDRPEGSGQPFDQIMNVLGGKGYLESNVYGDTIAEIIYDVTCVAPNEAVAIEIYNRYLGFNRRIRRAGTYLHFYRWLFDEYPQLPELIFELVQQGFRDVKYVFTQLTSGEAFELHEEQDRDLMFDILRFARDYDDRAQAAAFFRDPGDFEAFEPLMAALHDPAWPVQRNAARSLGYIGDPRAVDSLLQLFENTNTEIREAVIFALGRIGGDKAEEKLKSVAQNDPSERIRNYAENYVRRKQ